MKKPRVKWERLAGWALLTAYPVQGREEIFSVPSEVASGEAVMVMGTMEVFGRGDPLQALMLAPLGRGEWGEDPFAPGDGGHLPVFETENRS